MRIVLKGAKKDYVLEATLGDATDNNATQAVLDLFQQRSDDYIAVKCPILAAMEPELQKRFENWDPYETIVELKGIFQKQARSERFEISQSLLNYKMAEVSSVSSHVIKLHGYVQRLGALGVPFPPGLGTDIILNSLPPSYTGIVRDEQNTGRIVRDVEGR